VRNNKHFVPLSDLRCFSRSGRVFCVLTAYFDESFNDRTMCVGGWLCKDTGWKIIESKWSQRIKYEQTASKRRNEPQITRYHASDCSSRRGEFAAWSHQRQILFSRRLIEIIGRVCPAGVAAGTSLQELHDAFPALNQKELRWEAYKACMLQCLVLISRAMKVNYPDDRVIVIHDRGDFDGAAKSAFDDLFAAKYFDGSRWFVTIAPGAWTDFIALQPADLIAYEGFKLTDRCKGGNDEFRKSLQAIVGTKVPMAAGFFTADGWKELASGGLLMSTLVKRYEGAVPSLDATTECGGA
jgi:hypothetical protein